MPRAPRAQRPTSRQAPRARERPGASLTPAAWRSPGSTPARGRPPAPLLSPQGAQAATQGLGRPRARLHSRLRPLRQPFPQLQKTLTRDPEATLSALNPRLFGHWGAPQHGQTCSPEATPRCRQTRMRPSRQRARRTRCRPAAAAPRRSPPPAGRAWRLRPVRTGWLKVSSSCQGGKPFCVQIYVSPLLAAYECCSDPVQAPQSSGVACQAERQPEGARIRAGFRILW